MRAVFGCLAGLLGIVSVALAARYGYKGADTEVDGAISAVVFGLIALCAFLFDAAAVRLWFMRFQIGAGVIGLIAAAALVVTFTNSLGAIAGRSDTTLAERARAKDAAAGDRAELARISADRTALGAFAPAGDEDVTAARDAVATAERIRTAECERRGPRCRERETEEQGKRDMLVTVLARKALTDKAAKLDADAANARTRIAKAPAVQNANPLGAVLEQLIGAGSAALTAWQQAVVAAVFELCLVGVMVIYELLGQRGLVSALSTADEVPAGREKHRTDRAPSAFLQTKRTVAQFGQMVSGVEGPARERLVPTQALTSHAAKPSGSVREFSLTCLRPSDHQDAEMKDLLGAYRRWCAENDFSARTLSEFADDIRIVCAKAGIKIDTRGKRVLVRGVRLTTADVIPTSA